ncbi:hypothetical protein CO038_01480 [Candidatus Pacearchaeota archaeon CG_4_9_14_0_2_um_filter_39_13]|nr:hypothetical protein [Candidatus Pacearchaeota archaeon]OIO43785.1 MAG: hypothetical protein AUJ64_01735 [Candidatus Pacearchaeota archaeon CG1_02_39_14]PJC44880.1 MAG: hypothetical protein CO038_01480 [Candidatus Pacearchaeota archaeon CG_4_9_14_0_2_um_filter_39_13]
MYNRNNLPAIEEIGQRLEAEGLVSFGDRAWNQTQENCFEIASRLASLFGYQFPGSREQVARLILDERSERLWGSQSPSASPVCIAVRTPDECSRKVHLSLEAYGREYNFGPGNKEGFTIEMRIPLSLPH